MTTREKHPRYWLAGKREPDQDIFFREALASDWIPGGGDQWDTCWYTGMPAPEVFERMTAGKTINHIPGNNSLTVKSNLYRTLLEASQRMARCSGADSDLTRRLDFFPRTYCMPDDYHALQDAALDDPALRWILKPKNSARGKGISLVRDVSAVPTETSWMVQQYMDRPHTFDGHKYVLRLYVLVTSLDPLLVYVYREGSAKLASEPYAPDDPDNIYAHLTNPDINATNSSNPSPVVFISLENYRRWLREQGHDDERLFSRIHDLLALTLIAARERMLERTRAVQADTSGCYELLGIDCLVDEDLQPRILECNLSPSLEVCAAPQDGGDVEARNKRQLVVDMVALLGINDAAPPDATGSAEERIRARAAGELERAGGFERIHPTADVERFLPYFPFPRLSDMVLADAVTGGQVQRPRAVRDNALEIIDDSGLALYAGRDASLYRPNPTAAWIWLKASDGESPDDIATELLSAQPAKYATDQEAAWRIRETVWNTIADWATRGLLIQRFERTHSRDRDEANGSDAPRPASSPPPLRVRIGRFTVAIHAGQGAHRAALERAFASCRRSGFADDGPAEYPLHVVRSRRGYAISDANRLIAMDVPLNRLPSAVTEALVRTCQDIGSVGVIKGFLVSRPSGAGAGRAMLFAGDDPAFTSDVAAHFATLTGGTVTRGLGVPEADDAPVLSLGLPVLMEDVVTTSSPPDDDASASEGTTGGECHLDGIVICERSRRADSENRLDRLDGGDGFARLLPHCVIGDVSRPAAADVGKLWNWLRRHTILCARGGDDADAIAGLLNEHVKQDRSPLPKTGSNPAEIT